MSGSTFRYDSNRLTKKQLNLAYKQDIRELQRQVALLDNMLEHPGNYMFDQGKPIGDDILAEIKAKRNELYFQLENLKTEFYLAGL